MRAYLVLLRVEFTLLRTVTRRTVRSYRTLSPLPDPRVIGGLLSAALVVGLRPPGVTWHPALWSPDFPPLYQSPPAKLRDINKAATTQSTPSANCIEKEKRCLPMKKRLVVFPSDISMIEPYQFGCFVPTYC